jgi:hypothetical protein
MSPPLVRGRRTLEGRFRKLEQRLNHELGFRDQRLRFAIIQTRQGPITWRLRNQRHEATGSQTPDGTVANVASAASDDSILHFGYNEQWEPYGRDLLQFASSNLRFAIAGIADGVPDLRFRLEWAGGTTQDGIVSYPGMGAAHPHWQFDVDGGWFPVPGAVGVMESEVIDVALEPEVEDIDLVGANVVPPALQTATLGATLVSFHRLHLPARAMWHQMLCDMPGIASPQQHTPASEEEIDRWLISALRYLAHEFSAYL